jgi:hypothetical protein
VHQQPQFLRQLKTNPGKLNKKVRALVRSGGCLFSNEIRPTKELTARRDQADLLSPSKTKYFKMSLR